MRSSSKSRSRNKNNRNRSNPGNVVNRVFDSSGPEGKVRGTPQQIIDKYQTLARDAQLSGDRVNAENFLQHAEHYVRMLAEAQREIDARREQQEQQRQAQQNNQQQKNDQNQHGGGNRGRGPKGGDNLDTGVGEQPSLPEGADLFPADDDVGSNLVETPESEGSKSKPKRRRGPKTQAAEEPTSEQQQPDAAE